MELADEKDILKNPELDTKWSDFHVWHYYGKYLKAETSSDSVLDIGLNQNSGFRILNFFTVQLGYNKKTSMALEIWKPNIEKLGSEYNWINCDVREVNKHVSPGQFQLINWSHGPEHLPKEDVEPTLLKLQHLTGRILAVGCPVGFKEQEKAFGNPYEEHKCGLTIEDFEKLNFKILGRRGNIMAVYFK